MAFFTLRPRPDASNWRFPGKSIIYFLNREAFMEKIQGAELQKKLKTEKDSVCFVDVRSPSEFRGGHVPGAICLPLDQLEKDPSSLPRDKLVILGCQTGRRSTQAAQMLAARGFENLLELEGGFSAWAAAGLPVNRLSNTIPIFRQVLLTAGLLILLGTMLGITVHPGFLVIPLFMSAGLTFAGATGWCGLALLLEKMPWNRA
jgi:rhodanese-related sulfurtransferase